MKALSNWDTVQLSWDDTRASGYYHCPHILRYNGHEVILPSGESDHIELFEHDGFIVLLSSNSHHGYAGVDLYDQNMVHIAENFIQNCNDPLSPVYNSRRDFFDLTYNFQAKYLCNDIDY